MKKRQWFCSFSSSIIGVLLAGAAQAGVTVTVDIPSSYLPSDFNGDLSTLNQTQQQKVGDLLQAGGSNGGNKQDGFQAMCCAQTPKEYSGEVMPGETDDDSERDNTNAETQKGGNLSGWQVKGKFNKSTMCKGADCPEVEECKETPK